MNNCLKRTALLLLFFFSTVFISYAFLDSKTNPLKNLGEPNFVALAEMETEIADSAEATLFIMKNE